MRRRSALTALTALPLGAGFYSPWSQAAGFVDPAWALEGGWLVSVGEGDRDRFLVLSGVRLQGPQVVVDKAIYGDLDGKGKSVTDWSAVLADDTLRLHFTTPGGSQVDVEFKAEAPTALGQMKTIKNKVHPVRLTHLPIEELNELRTVSHSEASLKGLRLNRQSRIELLYVGAGDCPACRGYEVEYFGRKNLMAEKLPEFTDIIYTKAHLGSYRATGLASVLPAELAPLAQQGPKGEKPQLRQRGTPYFALMVDQKVLTQVHGVSSFETVLIPQIRQLVEMRRKAA